MSNPTPTNTRLRRHRRAILLLPFALSAVGGPSLSAQVGPHAANATVRNGDAQLRESYPTFAPSTFFKFRLLPGPVVTVIREGSRVTVLCRKTVADQEWYNLGFGRRLGWVYAGPKGRARHVRIDRGASVPECDPQTPDASMYSVIDNAMSALLLPRPLLAQSSGEVIQPPAAWVSQSSAVALALAQLMMFLGSVIVIRRWVFPESDVLTYLSSFSVLLVLGLINAEALTQLVGAVAG